MNLFRRDEGQAVVLSVVFMTVLLGMSGLVLDVGAWYRADRAAQATADAAALAAAQALPDNPAEAHGLAREYATKNGDGSETVGIAVTSANRQNDTVKVDVEAPASGIFTRVFGLDSVTVGATASARAGMPGSARYVAPVVVNINHPLLRCTPQPCFGEETTIDLIHLHGPGSGTAAGAFGLINLRGGGGSVGNDEVASWLADGFDGFMPLGKYQSVPSTMFNSTQFHGALDLRTGTDVLFPIYRSITGSGSTAEYDVVGWVGFNIAAYEGRGDDGSVTGHFTSVIWHGIQSESGGDPDYGVRVIQLVD